MKKEYTVAEHMKWWKLQLDKLLPKTTTVEKPILIPLKPKEKLCQKKQ